MAQALAKPDFDISGGIDAAASRLELAFVRLEAAVATKHAELHSHKVAREKLNHLLQDADKEIAKLKEVTAVVAGRLDRTIGVLEALEE